MEVRYYDVYLSFQGQDTRYEFISRLYRAFRNVGIHAFIDDDAEQELHSGDQITYTVVQAIEASRVSVVVLSQGYASSRWCLDELTKIMECRSTVGQSVIPVFNNVDPADVRDQRGPFEKDFQRHMDRFSNETGKVHSWRAALTEASILAGFEISTNSEEVEVIRRIVSHVITLLDSEEELIKVEHPVGVQSRTEDVIQLLHSHTPEDVVLMGIWGMAGVGKTIIASYVYNQIRHNFDSPMFLPNIRLIWKRDQVFLQEKLLNGICKELGGIKIKSIESGVSILKRRLCVKKVLVLLEDVNNIDQLNALCGSREWFGPGSIIIITTKNRRMLHMIGVDHVYQVKEMDYHESLELFSWNTFMQVTPLKEFARIANDVVEYCGGLPLALVSISHVLYGKMMIQEWESLLHRLKVKRIPFGYIVCLDKNL